MENLKIFLESSSIHGLSYISTSRRHTRLLWLIIVTTGFITAGVLIHQSFKGWADSPITTTVETISIERITYPKITVCPPPNTFTDLNYDLLMTQNMTLDNKTKNQLTKYAVELLHDHLLDSIMTNLSYLDEKDRYYKIQPPSNAKAGTIITIFDVNLVEANAYYYIRIYNNHRGSTLHVSIAKNSITEYGSDKFYHDTMTSSGTPVRADITHIAKNYNPPLGYSSGIVAL